MVNYPGKDVSYTRIAEYKHWPIQDDVESVKMSPWSHIVKEYSTNQGDPYYPVPNLENQKLYKRYQNLQITRIKWFLLDVWRHINISIWMRRL